jgi:hypothetical protein
MIPSTTYPFAVADASPTSPPNLAPAPGKLLSAAKWGILASILLVLLLLARPGHSQVPRWQWAVQAAGSSVSQVKNVAVDANGNTYLVGFFVDNIRFGSVTLASQGASDLFVAKLSSQGNWEWAVAAGGTGSDRATGVALDAEGRVFIAGSFSNEVSLAGKTLRSLGEMDVFVAQISTAGKWQWATSAGGPGQDLASALATTGTGELVVAGYFMDTAAFGTRQVVSNGSIDAFVAQLSRTGGWNWATAAGGASNDDAWALAATPAGEVYVTGYFSDTVTFGATTLTGRGTDDGFVGKLSRAGQWQWVAAATGTGTVYGRALVADPAGGVFITGSFSGLAAFDQMVLGADNDDGFVGRLSSTGQWQWVTAISSPELESVVGIARDKMGKLYVAGTFSRQVRGGQFELTSRGLTDVFVGYLSISGDWLGLASGGGADNDDAQAMALAPGGEVYIGGGFSTAASFGTSPLQSATATTQVYVGRATVPQP